MKCLILVAIVVLTVNMGDVSGGRWWRGLKKGVRNYWQNNKDEIIRTGIKAILSGRSVESLDKNADGVLDSSELSQHMEARDIDDMMSALGKDEVTEEDLKRYVSDYILDDDM